MPVNTPKRSADWNQARTETIGYSFPFSIHGKEYTNRYLNARKRLMVVVRLQLMEVVPSMTSVARGRATGREQKSREPAAAGTNRDMRLNEQGQHRLLSLAKWL